MFCQPMCVSVYLYTGVCIRVCVCVPLPAKIWTGNFVGWLLFKLSILWQVPCLVWCLVQCPHRLCFCSFAPHTTLISLFSLAIISPSGIHPNTCAFPFPGLPPARFLRSELSRNPLSIQMYIVLTADPLFRMAYSSKTTFCKENCIKQRVPSVG